MRSRETGPWEVTAYQVVLRVLPRGLARAHRDDMVDLFRDRIDELGLDRLARLHFLAATILDTLRHGPGAWKDVRSGEGRRRDRRVPGGSGRSHRLEAAPGGAEAIWRELRFAARFLWRSPLFTVIAITTLALGIGASTALFTIADVLLFRSLPVHEPERLVRVAASESDGDTDGLLAPMVDLIRDEGVFADICGVITPSVIVEMAGRIAPFETHAVTGDCFAALGVSPAIGRLLIPSDAQPGASHAVVLAYDTWMSEFDGSSSALGQAINVDGVMYDIVGVAPAGFRGLRAGFPARLFIPLGNFEGGLGAYFPPWPRLPMTVLGRLHPGTEVEGADAHLRAHWQAWLDATVPPGSTATQMEQYRNRELRIGGVRGTIDGRLRNRFETPVLALLALSALVLMAMCVNLAHLALARSAARSRELEVRVALGASKGTLVRGVALESGMLFAIGGLGATALAYVGDVLLVDVFSAGAPGFSVDVTPDARSLGFITTASLLAFLLVVILPMWRAGRVSGTGLTSAARHVSGRCGGAGRAAVAAQVILTVIFVSAGISCITWVAGLRSASLGFSTLHVLSAQLSPLPGGYVPGKGGTVYYGELLDRVAAIPGVAAAALSYNAPLSGASWMVSAGARDGESEASMEQAFVSEGFFAAMRIPLVAGSTFAEYDALPDSRGAVLSESAARAVFGTTAVVGRRTRIGSAPILQDVQIIGVAGDAMLVSPKASNPRVAYLSFWQFGSMVQSYATLITRTRGDEGAVVDALGEVVRQGDLEYISRIRTLDEQRDASVVEERFMAWIATAFGALGLTLSAVGLYGLLGLLVIKRRAEFGVRMAVGAGRSDIVSLVLREAWALMLAGAVIGGIGAWALERLARRSLAGMPRLDWPALALAIVLVLSVGCVAAWLPARRASRADPAASLRE